MEVLIAILLLIVMYMFESNKISHFVNLTDKNILENSVNNIPVPKSMKCDSIISMAPVKNQYKQVIWIFNDYDVSSRHWQAFYSRKNRQPTPAIVDLCIQTVKMHSGNHFIRVFDQNSIHRLLPEYEDLIQKCTSFYFAYNFIKYAILYKYGGIWIPSDTLMLKPLSNTDYINSNHIVTFGYNNMQSIDNKGYSDIIIGCKQENPSIGKMIDFFKNNLKGFQNGLFFHKSVNKYLNKLLRTTKLHFNSNQLIVHKRNGSYLNTDDLFSSNIPDIDEFCSKTVVHLNMYHVNNLPRFNYVLRMSKDQIIQSRFFMSMLIRYSKLHSQ